MSNTSFIKPGTLVKDNKTGAAAIAHIYTAVRACRVLGVSLHFSAAPVTSGNLTIVLDANAGVGYDIEIHSVNPSSPAITNLLWQPSGELWLEPGDSLKVAFANADSRTYGSQIAVIEMV
jgi:hypothetical protein